MKFFKKDKRKAEGARHSAKPGDGDGNGNGNRNTRHLKLGGKGGNGYRNDGYRAFGSPPVSPHAGGRGMPSPELQFQATPTLRSAAALLRFPDEVLQRIFAFVCPHTRDESYETSEQSALEDECTLCSLRDLAHCLLVRKAWRTAGVKVMYHSIRIDPVHYCEREAYLAEQRKRRTRFDRNGDPEDPTRARLKLLCRTLRDDPVRLGRVVEFLKLPYMLRESNQADLARTIAVLPNLKYVDLPEGLFVDDPSYITLRMEVQARCHDLRKMTYVGGSEQSLQRLASGTIWPRLEVLELIRVSIDPTILRQVLGCLGNLRALKISETKNLGDEIFSWSDMMPPFPPLVELILTDVPNVTAEGLKAWLSLAEARQALRVLTLNGTGVKVWTMHEILAYGSMIRHLAISDSMDTATTAAAGTLHIPPLSSSTLETLRYEITAGPSSTKFSSITSSYYNYLAISLLSGGLANLRSLYVREPNFPEMLLGLPPPMPNFAEGGIARPKSSGSSHTAFSSHMNHSSKGMSPNFAPISPQGFLSPVGSPGHPPLPQYQFLSPTANQSPFKDPPARHRPQGSLNSIRNQRFSSNNPFANLATGGGGGGGGCITNLPARLEVFTKGDDEMDWSFVKITPGSTLPRGKDRNGVGARPLSSYGLGADLIGGGGASGWSSNAGARKSVLIGGAGGAFHALPADRGEGEDLWPRPKSSVGEKKTEKLDLWR